MLKNCIIILTAIAISIFSCSPHLKTTTLTEEQSWKLSYRMLYSIITEESGLALQQFDSLLKYGTTIQPKIFNAGLENLLKERGQEEAIKILGEANENLKKYLCEKNLASQLIDSNGKNICKEFDSKKSLTNPELQKELVVMFINDQTVRGGDMTYLLKEFNLTLEEISYNAQAVQVDSINRERLKKIISTHGFPTKAMVGDVGMNSIFFIIQHSDMDKDFQLSQFENIKKAVSNGDLDAEKFAYLCDRIKINTGEKQLYGTQFSNVDPEKKIVELAPTEDPQNIDKRRMELGMMPIDIYKAIMLSSISKK